MTGSVLRHGEQTGEFNMAFDLMMTRYAKPGNAQFRLYRWKPYCVSLGVHQPENELLKSVLTAEGIDIVRRPTGGRAVYHSGELTYSFVTELNEYDSPLQWYRDINSFLLQGLIAYHPSLAAAQLEELQPAFRTVYAEKTGAACFAVAAKNEVKVAGKKLIGSAQRKMGKILLQHGSILCTREHERIGAFLNINNEEKNAVEAELLSSTTTVETITGLPVDYHRLEDCLSQAFTNFITTYRPQHL